MMCNIDMMMFKHCTHATAITDNEQPTTATAGTWCTSARALHFSILSTSSHSPRLFSRWKVNATHPCTLGKWCVKRKLEAHTNTSRIECTSVWMWMQPQLHVFFFFFKFITLKLFCPVISWSKSFTVLLCAKKKKTRSHLVFVYVFENILQYTK